MVRAFVNAFVLCLLLQSASAVTLSQRAPLTKEGPAPTQRTHADAQTRARQVVAQMTFAEKASLLHGSHFSIIGPEDGYYTGFVPSIKRLGVPPIKMSDAGNGFRPTEIYNFGTTTSWPCLLGLASTWDLELVGEVAEAIGQEFKGKGANVILGPSINVHRSARGGRNFEYFSGEDPFLGAKMTTAYVEHVQKEGVMSMPKHFAFNEQETNRDHENSLVDEQTAWEIYYPPFEAAARAGAGAIMCAYNKVNGTFACENPKMVRTDLKKRMGMDGFVTSDWGATHTINAVAGGEDMEMPGPNAIMGMNVGGILLQDAVRSRYSDQDISEAAVHILTSIYRLRLDETPQCEPPACTSYLHSDQTSPAHTLLTSRAATGAVTLLKNDDDTLPITPHLYKSIAIVGSVAFAGNSLSPPNYYSGGGSGAVPAKFVNVTSDEITKRASEAGIHVFTSSSDSVAGALQAAEKADLVIVVGGGTTSEGLDRANLHLDGNLDQLISQVSKVTKTVVLMQTPGAMVMPWRNDASAILNLFMGGQATGAAWASVLFGDYNPTGKLPIMMPETDEDVINPGLGNDVSYSEGMHTSYRNPALRAAYPFGHGLSYTSFYYHPILLVDRTPEGFTLDVLVRNIGSRTGSEVVQAYLEFPEETLENSRYPHLQLRGFEATGPIVSKQTKTVTLNFFGRDISTYSVQKSAWVVQKLVRVYIGASSGDLRQTIEVQL